MLFVARPHDQPGLQLVRTPWRVAVIGRLATIVESDLVDDLARARPGRRLVVGQARAGRVVLVGRQREPGQPRRAEGLRRLRRARMGWEYVLVDAGWDPAWMPQLVAYARRRHVRVHASGRAGTRWRSRRARDALLSQLRSWGVAGVKLDFMESDSFERMAWYRGVARAAAERRLVVNFHGSTAPRGLERSWPNVLTSEAVLGAESYKGDVAVPITAAHNATLPFTRNAIGSMDYTPVTFSAARRQTSAAHELALSIVFESGLQHFADRPDAYLALPPARRWLRDVPPAWDDTRLLAGYPGDSATIARRSGRSWYVGAIAAGAPRAVRLPLDFLFPGRRYRARIVEDAPGGTLRQRELRVTARRVLRLQLGPAGGYVDPLRTARALTQSGRRPGRPVPGRCQCAISGSSTIQHR